MSFSKQMLDSQMQGEQSSMSLEDAIQEYVSVDAQYQELARRKRRALEILLPEAEQVRGIGKTARLENNDKSACLKVEFGEAYKCEVDRLNTVKELVGDDVFEGLFKVEYSPLLRQLKPFLASKSTDERIETAKGIIREAVTTSPKQPQITIEKGRSESPF